MSIPSVIWRSRQMELQVAQATWIPQVVALLDRIGNSVTSVFNQTHNDQVTEDSLNTLMRAPMIRLMEAMYQDSGLRFIKSRGEQLKTVLPTDVPLLEAWYRTVLAQRIIGIMDGTREELATILATAREQGVSVERTAQKIRELTGFSRARAIRIARTELISTANAATHFSLALDIPVSQLTKSWFNAGDERVRNDHNDPDLSTQIPYDTPFNVGGYGMLFPGDSSLGAPASEIVNCRCTALYYNN